GENAPRLPNTTNLMVDYAEGEGLVISLDLKGVAVTTGSACSSGSLEPSHVLTAIGTTPDEANGSLRVSISSMTTEADIDYVQGGHIRDAKFKAQGCRVAIATSSYATEMHIGMNVADARLITKEQIADALGGLPASKIHCSVLASDAIKQVLEGF